MLPGSTVAQRVDAKHIPGKSGKMRRVFEHFVGSSKCRRFLVDTWKVLVERWKVLDWTCIFCHTTLTYLCYESL